MTMPSDARSYIVCCYKQPTGLSKKRRQPAAATLFSDVRSSIAHCYKQPTGLSKKTETACGCHIV
jgi:hypothetical protein